MQNRDPKLETSGDPVGFYEREFYVFSNFSSFQVEWKDRLWPTSEHVYQAAKFFEVDEGIVNEIHNAKSAHKACKLAKETYLDKKPDDWMDRKVDVMEDICRHKLRQHDYVEHKLKQTGDRRLVEDSLKDDFWGWGPDKDGRNALDKVWMRLRDEWQRKHWS